MTIPAYKTALVTYPHTQALKDGTVAPRTFRFEFEEVPVIVKAFRRMVRGLDFDISEMAITTYLTAKSYGKRFTAIPVFPMRAFHHGAILYNVNSDIRSPKDLEGRKVGVNRVSRFKRPRPIRSSVCSRRRIRSSIASCRSTSTRSRRSTRSTFSRGSSTKRSGRTPRHRERSEGPRLGGKTLRDPSGPDVD